MTVRRLVGAIAAVSALAGPAIATSANSTAGGPVGSTVAGRTAYEQGSADRAAYKGIPVYKGIPRVVEGRAESLHPEGVAWDPTRRAFLAGSIRHGTVSVVTRDGRVRTLVSDPRMVSTFGLHVDAARGRVLVTYADMGLGARSTPATTGVQSGVGIFDLRTGRLLHLVNLSLGPGKHTANDLAIDRTGTAYVTDPSSDTIYRVTPDGRGSVFARDARYGSTSIGLNGIAWHPAGYLLVVKYDDGTLFRIPLRHPERVSTVGLDRPLVGGDGIALHRDGTLVAMTNSLGAPGEDAVTVLRPRHGWTSARSRTTAWPVQAPTTVAVTPYGDYAVSGHLEVLLAGDTTDAFTLRRR